MSQVGTTAAAKDVEPRQSFLDRPILFAKLDWITVVQHLALIEFGVALARSVATDAPDAASMSLRRAHGRSDRVRTIHHEFGRRPLPTLGLRPLTRAYNGGRSSLLTLINI